MLRFPIALALLLMTLSPAPSDALFHTALISEVMSGVNGDPSVQYVEIRVASGVASAVGGSVLTAFNCAGTSHSVLLTVPSNIAHGAAGDHWIMATSHFAAAAGITPDFTWDPTTKGNIDPTCGMVCWGGVGAGAPTMPDASNPDNYVDCVGYGGYAGSTKTSTHDGTPVSGIPSGRPPGDGMQSLTRLTATGSNLADFQLADPTPTNNAGAVGVFGGGTTTTIVSTTTTSTAPGATTTTDTTPTTIGDTSTTTTTATTATQPSTSSSTVTSSTSPRSTTTTLPETACAPSVACDDGNACSVDRCVPGTGCVHDVLSAATALGDIEPACAGQSVPPSVEQQLARGCGLIQTARTQTPKKAKGTLAKAVRALKRAGKAAAKAGTRKKSPISADCATGLRTVVVGAQDQALRQKSGL